jgi:hypothetical protein
MIYEIEGLVPNQTDSNGVTFTGSTGVTPVPSNITSDALIEVTIAPDPNPIFNFRGEESDYTLRMEDDAFILRNEQGVTYLPFLNMTWTDTFGISFVEPIFINL